MVPKGRKDPQEGNYFYMCILDWLMILRRFSNISAILRVYWKESFKMKLSRGQAGLLQ
jgi:hypothetical protein